MAFQNVDGILLLDKPSGITSNAALQSARRLFVARKAGHGGTLDPLASGLLVVAFGEATKFSGMLLEAEKTYAAEIRLGVTTVTGDAEGDVTDRRPVNVDDARLQAALASFVGSYEQLPPAFSALKYQGRPLYDYARAGQDPPRARRRVEISRLHLESRDGDRVQVVVTCSKGTYIRSLAEDIGSRLGCGAHLAGLRRLASGCFRLVDAAKLADLEVEAPERRRARLLPLEEPLRSLPEAVLPAAEAASVLHGQSTRCAPGVPVGLVRLYVDSTPRRFVGLGEVTGAGKLLPRRLVAVASG
jgi:tRNA pseudouridine55 synthase